ncbi:DMT family transporter [Comamonas nitrativorans]|uniref:DMT family transporter n=1 Tax=Comamonas nitrativorans TaxID=108437 RepID=A0ABV9H0E9_9BURK
MSLRFAPHVALTLNALVWGLSWWPFQTMLAAGLAAPWATALMYAVLLAAMGVLAPGAWRHLRHDRALWLLALAAGLTNVAFNTAMSFGDVVRVILLFYLMPAWAVMLAWRFLGERPSRMAVLRLVLAFAGMALVILPTGAQGWQRLGSDFSVADGLGLFAGICFAITNVTLRHPSAAPASARMLAMFAGCMGMGLLSALLGCAVGWLPGLPPVNAVWVVAVLGMAALVAGGNWALQFGAARLPTATTSVIMLSEVLFASGSAWLLGATQLTAQMLLGGGLIVGGALLAALAP